MAADQPPWVHKARFGIGAAALAALTALLSLAVWALAVPLALGWFPAAITSGSMGPKIDAGDIVIAAPYDGTGLGVGTIIVFANPVGDGLVTHRIVDVSPTGDYITRGDSNGRIDSTPTPPQAIKGVGRIMVPFAGHPSVWAATGNWPPLLLIAIVLGLMLWMSRWGLLTRFDPWQAGSARSLETTLTTRRTFRAASSAQTTTLLAIAFLMVGSVVAVVRSSSAFADTTAGTGSAMTGDALEPPTGLTASDGISVALDWAATPDAYATGHRVYRASVPGGPYSQVAEVAPRTATAYVDAPSPGTYYYVVRAYYLGWESVSSSEAAATALRPETFIALDGGLGHTCGSRVDGSVWCWGRNDKGQVGNGVTGNDVDIPVQVVGPGGVGVFANAAGVVTGSSHSCAVKTDGTVWCWGLNDFDQLGDNTGADSNVPVQVVGAGGSGTLTGVAAIAGGESHTCAVKNDGTVWCWGRNDKGQLGNNTTTDSSVPVQVVGAGGVGVLSGAAETSAGVKNTCVTKTDGTVWCWGLNNKGQLGNNATTDSSVPVQVVGAGGVGVLSGAASVGLGASHSCVTKTDGTVWCWGLNDFDQLGDNSGADSSVPVQVVGAGGVGVLNNATDVAAGFSHTCVLNSAGTVWCWGRNNKGQLGNNTTNDSLVPVQVVGADGTGYLTSNAVAATGDNHSCAAKTDDTVWCWGLNSDAQLGNNTTTDTPKPTQAMGV